MPWGQVIGQNPEDRATSSSMTVDAFSSAPSDCGVAKSTLVVSSPALVLLHLRSSRHKGADWVLYRWAHGCEENCCFTRHGRSSCSLGVSGRDASQFSKAEGLTWSSTSFLLLAAGAVLACSGRGFHYIAGAEENLVIRAAACRSMVDSQVMSCLWPASNLEHQ